MAKRKKLGCEYVKTITYQDKEYRIWGCWDEETEEGEYDFYDVMFEGGCINLGEPFYELPTQENIAEFVN